MSVFGSHVNTYFSAGGALDPSAPSYVTRACDREALEFLLQRRYVCILGPRQVGKTSLINKLHANLDRAGIASAVIDLSGFPGAGASVSDADWPDRTQLAAEWYVELALTIAEQFSSTIDPSSEVRNRPSFSRFLNRLEVISQEGSGAVIMLDEAASVPDSLKTEFFMLLRTLLNTRPNKGAQIASRFTFVFAGAFYPSALVTNPNVSPFNVSETIYVPDFTHAEVSALLSGFTMDGIVIEADAAEQVWLLAHGHPFLTQKLCTSALSLARARTLANGGERTPIRREDVQDAARTIGGNDPHLQSLVQRLDTSPAEVELIRRVVIDNESVPFSPLVNPAAKQLEMIGALSEDRGYAQVRNPIYGKVLREYLSARS